MGWKGLAVFLLALVTGCGGAAPAATKININAASAAELESLPGIGSVLAGRIVAYREEHGPFQRIEDIVDVMGIGPATFQKIKGSITVGPLPGQEATPLPTYPLHVSFITGDGVVLWGHLFGDEGPGVVLSHMYPADQTSWYPFAERLGREGYRALTFDFRGYGESEGSKDIALIPKDVKAALDYLHSQEIEQVFLIGASMGGTASLIVAAQEEVAGVITLSAPREFKGLKIEDITQVAEPKLFLAAEGDAPAAAMAEEFYDQARGRVRAIIYQVAAGHGTDLFNKVGSGLDDDILRFLSENS